MFFSGINGFTKSPEKNTKVENDAFFAIEEFIELSYGRRLKYNTIQLFESFLKIKEDKRYKDVLMLKTILIYIEVLVLILKKI